MDFFILINVTFAFFLFFILHLVIFRIISADKVFNGLMFVFLLAGFISIILGIWLDYILFHFAVNYLIFGEILVLFLYFIITLFYILAFFGISVTSLRINVLSLINRTGRKGLTYEQILRTYNKDIIVETRLQRLMGSGVLGKVGGKYKVKDIFSYFVFHTYLFGILRRLYQGSKYER